MTDIVTYLMVYLIFVSKLLKISNYLTVSLSLFLAIILTNILKISDMTDYV